jgi:hypothetical protein
MSNRITVSQLESRVEYLNKITGSPETSWTKKNEIMTANIGNHYLDGAYGGYDVCQIMNEGGGVNSLFNYHRPKRELYEKLNSYISGIQAGIELKEEEHVNIHTTFGDLQELAEIEDFEEQNNLEK